MDTEKKHTEKEEMKKDKKAKRASGGSRLTLWLLVSIGILVIVGIIAITPYMVKGSHYAATIRIPKNATITNVKDTLTKYYGEDYTGKVMKLLKLGNFKPEERYGAYDFPEGTSAFAVMRKLTRGGQSPVRLTINGFRSIPFLAERISAKMDFSTEDFIKAATDSTFLAQYGLNKDNALALFVDDTYEVYWTSSPEEVLKKIGENYQNLWSEVRVEDAKDLGLKPVDVMIIASIVDDETNQDREKGRIGRLYINRLDTNMKLQADPTVRFALQDFTIKRVTEEHLKFDSPYNTYKYAGLPPGPLRTTSRKTVTSILQSQPSNDLYMCAREDFSGHHNFAPTYEEHLKNAKRYQAALDERGIK